ncbi:sensor histidine kinase [Halobaculum gomorrense]|uniref:histidine kinase n=1 Tax=Halobaculum gomorrense TaxID=43928 RepID=A0A1M5NY90_9EURY|nr:PAS domain S-box protein [Halobaculum gomorrense]SHG93943.1 PAS domain S-box-containing protein [Halobaculum gomorrense]
MIVGARFNQTVTDPDLPTAPQDFYQTLVENAAEGMLTIDEESTIWYANPAVEEILGYSPDELVGRSKMVIIPERLRAAHAEALAAYVESGDRNIDWDGMELPALHKDGTEVSTLISLREHTHGGESVTVHVGRLDDGDGIFVADDRPGVPTERRGAIFDRGYSTRERGTGFGLSIVEQIASGHGWEVAVTDADPAGARFELRDMGLRP